MTAIPSSIGLAGEARHPLIDRDRRRALARVPPRARGRYLAVYLEGGLIVLPVATPVTVLGRGLGCHIRFDEPTLSRRHAVILDRDGAGVLADERSTNGTWLNGTRVTEAVLRHGDTIVLGKMCLEYLEPGLHHAPRDRSARRPVGSAPASLDRAAGSADGADIATRRIEISHNGS